MAKVSGQPNFRNVLCLAVLIIAAQQPRAMAIQGGRPPDVTGSGFVNAAKYQVWTPGVAMFAYQTTPVPQITGLGNPSFTGTLVSPQPLGLVYVPNSTTDANWSVPHGGVITNVSVQWDGYFFAAQDGTYQFSTVSDDGSALFIGTKLVVNSDTTHAVATATGQIVLNTGYHLMTIMYGQGSAGFAMTAASQFSATNPPGAFANARNIDLDFYLRLLPTPTFSPASGSTLAQSVTVTINELWPSVAPISSVMEAAGTNTVTVTTLGAHGLTVGQTVQVAGVTNTSYNGNFLIVSVPSPTTLTYTNPTKNLAASSGGTVALVGTIYYTTDGTNATTSSMVYTAPFPVAVPHVVNAIATLPGFNQSANGIANYTQTPASTPTFQATPANISSGNFTGTQTVTITSSTLNSFIYYTTDGTTPTFQNYTGVGPSPLSFSINSTTTVKAFAGATSFAGSAVVTATFTRTDVAPFVTSCLASAVPTQVNVVFNTAMNPALANVMTNYTIDNGIMVTNAALDADTKTVRLTLSPATPLVEGVGYNLTISNLADTKGNLVAPLGMSVSTPFQYFNGGGLQYDRYENVPGANVSDLLAPASPANAFFPDFPSTDSSVVQAGGILPTFEEPQNTTITSYGSRMSGYFIPPATDTYLFAITADDTALFSISSDDNPSHKNFATAKVTKIPKVLYPRQWNYDAAGGNENHVSVTLVAGTRYYIESLHKQDISLDNLAVAYVNPPQTLVDTQGAETLPIDSQFNGNIQLSPAVDALRIVSQPSNVSATPNQTVNLIFDVSGSSPRTVQWTLNGNVIPNATFPIYTIANLSAADGGTYVCQQTNPINTVTSNPAVVTVIDPLAPTVQNVTPNFASLGGVTDYPAPGNTQAVINGTDFVAGMLVTFNGKPVTILANTSTTLTINVPTSNVKGAVNVAVTKPGKQTITLIGGFIYDDIPTATPQTVQTLEDNSVSGTLAASDPTDKIVSFKIVQNPAKGTVTLGSPITNVAGSPMKATIPFTYVPFANQNNSTAPAGPDTFTFSASDGLLNSLPAVVTVNITPVNDAPLINNPGNQVVTEDQPVTINLTGIAVGPATATDEIAGQTITSIMAVSNVPSLFQTQDGNFTNTLKVGTLVNGTAPLTFTPAYGGSATITVTVTDSGSGIAPNVNTTVITFNVTVSPVNDAPTITNPGPQSGTADQSATINLTGIAAAPPNNPDESGQTVLLTLNVTASDPTYFTSLTSHPSIANGNATITYIPAFARNGPVTITVTLDDHQAVNNQTTIQFVLNLAAVNHPPNAVNDSYTPTINKVLKVPAPGVLANDSDVDGNSITAVLASPPGNGTLVLNPDGSFTYTPNAGFQGTDSFSYQANDGNPPKNLSNVAVVTLNVGANLAPVANNLSFAGTENIPVNGQLTASDPNFDTVTYALVTPPTKGTVSINPGNGAFTYTPNTYSYGADSFTFKANDGQLDSNIATVTLNIAHVNQAPVAMPQAVFVGQNRSIVFSLSATDVDGDLLTYSITTPPVNGTVVQATPGSATVTYTPKGNFVGSDSFQFTVKDAALTSAPATVSISVTPPPVFSALPTITPNPVLAGSTVTGMASAIVTNGTALISWDFGDGNTATGTDVTHVYNQVGVYILTVTATSPEGLATAFQQTVQVGFGLTGVVPPGTIIPGVFGFLVGGSGVTAGDKSTLSVNYVLRDKTTFSGTVSHIAFPAILNQGQLINQVGILTVGQGPLAQQFVFTLDSRGRGKATSLPSLNLLLTKGTLSFTVNLRRELTDLFIALDTAGTVLPNGHQLINVPVTLQIGNSILLAMTFELDYKQTGTTGKGMLVIPAKHR